MADIFSEVDEEVRKDKSIQLWKKYGIYIIAACVIIVVGTAAVVGWKNYRLSQAEADGAVFENAVALAAAGNHAGAADAFGALAIEGTPGYQALARLRQAKALIAAGRTDEALAAYDALAADEDADESFRAIARLQAGYLVLDSGSTADIRSRIAGLDAAGTPWSPVARELLALSDLKDGNLAAAREQFKALQDDAAVSQGVKDRARLMLTAIGE